jgi:hypothetical protein
MLLPAVGQSFDNIEAYRNEEDRKDGGCEHTADHRRA